MLSDCNDLSDITNIDIDLKDIPHIDLDYLSLPINPTKT